jgi:hypothetical protein
MWVKKYGISSQAIPSKYTPSLVESISPSSQEVPIKKIGKDDSNQYIQISLPSEYGVGISFGKLNSQPFLQIQSEFLHYSRDGWRP